MSLEIRIDFDDRENMWLVKPKGDLDIYTSNKFREDVLSSFEEKETNILVDGEGLEYVDSTGLGALISILKVIREKDKEMHITNIKPNIRKIFDITELDKLFVIRGEKDE
ncbi:MAG TPA: STAS domain-containing protein [Tissierellaceae bacterium]|nr:STAS domain-containing protein [Tissierellaceae bacterium]